MFLAVVVDRHVGWIGPVGKLFFDVGDQRARCPALGSRLVGLLKGREVDKGFDRTAGLAWGQRHVDLSVDLDVVKIGAADQRQHLACVGAHGHQRAVGRIVLGKLRDLISHDALCRFLQRRIEGGRHVEPGLVERLGTEQRLQLLLDIEREMGRLQIELQRRVVERLLPGSVSLGLGDFVVLDHEAKHHALAFLGSIRVAVGIVVGGQLGQPGQQRCLAQRQLAGILGKVGLGRGIDAVGKVAVKEFV